jgi:uncharacterized protein YacL
MDAAPEPRDSHPLPIEPASARVVRYDPPSVIADRERRSQKVLLLAIRMIFMVLLVTATLLPFVGAITRNNQQEAFTLPEFFVVFSATFAFGAAVVTADALTPNKRLASLFGVSMGIIVGLVGAWAIGLLADLVADSWDLAVTEKGRAYMGLIKVAFGISLCYLAVTVVLTTKDDLRLVIPYVEFSKQVRGVRPMLIDSSVLIDGRIESLGEAGFLDAPLVVPEFVLDELQTLADSSDKLKREKGRRGLNMVNKLQNSPFVDISIDETRVESRSVDHMLLESAAKQNLRLLTTDYNLNKVAQIRGVSVLNLNDLASALRTQVVPGEGLAIEIVKLGESPGQGVGYLPDGTMVVVEDGAASLHERITATVTNSLQTSAGRLIFARVGTAPASADSPAAPDSSRAEQLARAATTQPRMTARPAPIAPPTSARNPRR